MEFWVNLAASFVNMLMYGAKSDAVSSVQTGDILPSPRNARLSCTSGACPFNRGPCWQDPAWAL